MLFSVIASSLLAVGAVATPLTTSHVVHEKRSALPHGWVRRGAVNKREILPMRIALTQSNMDKGHDWLMDVSTPDSENYGKHWTAEDVVKAFAPRYESSWLIVAFPDTAQRRDDHHCQGVARLCWHL